MVILEKLKILTPLQKLPRNVGDLGKLIVALKSCTKSNKSPNLVTLARGHRPKIFPNLVRTIHNEKQCLFIVG